MFNDWKLHPLSNNAYQMGIFSPITPPLGSVNAYRVSSAADASLKRLIYVNRPAGVVNGNQEISAAFKFDASVADVRVGAFVMWDGLDFDETENAYVVESGRLTGDAGHYWRMRSGTGRTSTILSQVGPVIPPFDIAWTQLAIQVKFDTQFNAELRFFSSDPNVDPVTVPVWTLIGGPLVIPRADTLYGGQIGFFVESQQAVFDLYVDHLLLNTILAIP